MPLPLQTCSPVNIPNTIPSAYLLSSKYRPTWINFKIKNKETRTTPTVSLLLTFIVNFTYSNVFIGNFEHTSHLTPVFLFLFTLFLYKTIWKIERKLTCLADCNFKDAMKVYFCYRHTLILRF